jgi:hypothetical protein
MSCGFLRLFANPECAAFGELSDPVEDFVFSGKLGIKRATMPPPEFAMLLVLGSFWRSARRQQATKMSDTPMPVTGFSMNVAKRPDDGFPSHP